MCISPPHLLQRIAYAFFPLPRAGFQTRFGSTGRPLQLIVVTCRKSSQVAASFVVYIPDTRIRLIYVVHIRLCSGMNTGVLGSAAVGRRRRRSSRLCGRCGSSVTHTRFFWPGIPAFCARLRWGTRTSPRHHLCCAADGIRGELNTSVQYRPFSAASFFTCSLSAARRRSASEFAVSSFAPSAKDTTA